MTPANLPIFRAVADVYSEQMPRLLLASGALVAAIVGGFLLVSFVRNRMRRQEQSGGAGFTLSDLRALRAGGKMSEEEFNRAKSRVVEAARRAAERDAPARSPAPRARGEQKRD